MNKKQVYDVSVELELNPKRLYAREELIAIFESLGIDYFNLTLTEREGFS